MALEPIVILFLLLLLGWFTAVVVLLVNPKTRKTGLIVLGVPMGLLPVLFVAASVLWWFRLAPIQPEHNTVIHQPPTAIQHLSRHRPPSPPAPFPQAGEGNDKSPSKDRPAWVDAPARLVDDVYQMSIMVGPYSTRQECDAHLGEALQEALDRYAEICLGERPTTRITLPPDLLRRQLVEDEWEEVGQYSVGPMTQLHVLLQFDRKLKDRVLEEYRRGIVAGRLWYAGVALAAVLAALTAGYGYLKMTGGKM